MYQGKSGAACGAAPAGGEGPAMSGIKGYVWGGSLHGQVTVQQRYSFVVGRCGDSLELRTFQKPYPKWKQWACKLIGVPQSPPVPMVETVQEVYEARFWQLGPRRICIFQLQGGTEPTDEDRMHIFRTHRDLAEIVGWPFEQGLCSRQKDRQ